MATSFKTKPQKYYTINLTWTNNFKLLYTRILKWRQYRESFYNLAYSIVPYATIYSIPNGINTYRELVTNTTDALKTIEKYYESRAILETSTKSFINTSFDEFTDELSTNETSHNELAQRVSYYNSSYPISYWASENLNFDIVHLKNGVEDILKTYGYYNYYNTTNQKTLNGLAGNTWIMNSRIDAYKAINLLISEYPILPQIIKKFGDKLPTTTSSIINTETLNSNPIFYKLYTDGLDELLSVPNNKDDDNGTFILKYCDYNGSTTTTTNLIDFTAGDTSIVTDKNSYNLWLIS